MDKLLHKIQGKLTPETALQDLGEKLSGTEFNSFLLEVFRLRAEKVKAVDLLQSYRRNRFVGAAKIHTIKNLELELAWLKISETRGFVPITLSPLAPLGTCAAMGKVNQNKVVSSLRGTEVVADATNVLAIQIAQDFQQVTNKSEIRKYATVHRHVRSQALTDPNHSAHFGIFCLASGGFDSGGYGFELQQLREHVGLLLEVIHLSFPGTEIYAKVYLKNNDDHFANLLRQHTNLWRDIRVEFKTDLENKYYQVVQVKLFMNQAGTEINLADGGMVDWTQRLLGNRKHRMMISGIGTELAQKLISACKL